MIERTAPSARGKGRPKKFADAGVDTTIQSVDRAIAVLDTLASHGALTLTDLARAMDQSPATVYRILCTFQARGMVEADPLTQQWSIGASALRIGASFLRRNSVTANALPAMRDLMQTTGETSNLGIERSGAVMFISQVETHESIRAYFPPGTQSPMHASGIGKALLATWPEARMQGLLQNGPLQSFAPNTIISRDGVISEMRQIRARGYAVDDEERTVGMRCIAASIMDYQGQAVAGISISGPSHRVTPDRVAAIGARVKTAADAVSRMLGADI